LNSAYYPLAQYPSYVSAGDVPSSSLVVNYSAVSDATALPPVASKLESQAASATYTTPLGMARYNPRTSLFTINMVENYNNDNTTKLITKKSNVSEYLHVHRKLQLG